MSNVIKNVTVGCEQENEFLKLAEWAHEQNARGTFFIEPNAIKFSALGVAAAMKPSMMLKNAVNEVAKEYEIPVNPLRNRGVTGEIVFEFNIDITLLQRMINSISNEWICKVQVVQYKDGNNTGYALGIYGPEENYYVSAASYKNFRDVQVPSEFLFKMGVRDNSDQQP